MTRVLTLYARTATKKARGICRSRRAFFGLTNEYIEHMYEQFFLLKYHGGWSFIEAYNLPTKIRMWFLDRLIKQKNDEAEASK